MNYLAVRCWIGLWICLILLLTNCLSVSREYGMNYLAVRCWIGLWICLILLLTNCVCLQRVRHELPSRAVLDRPLDLSHPTVN